MDISIRSALAASGYIGIWETDLSTQTIELTGAIPRLLGIAALDPPQAVPLTVFLEGVHPEDREHVAHLVHEAHQTAGRFEAEFRTRDRSGLVHWVAARGRVETHPSGRGLRCIGVMADLTDSRKAAPSATDHMDRTIDRVVDTLITLRSLAKNLNSPILLTLIDTMLFELGTVLAKRVGSDGTEQVH